MMGENGIQQTVNHLFRTEAGKMVAVLSRLLGAQNIELAEDIVQDSLLQALNVWSFKGIPDNPAAWLYRVAKNKAIDAVRKNRSVLKHNDKYAYLLQSEYTLAQTIEHSFQEQGIQDSQLQMIFLCMHPLIPVSSQMALALKTLCALSSAEIARAFLTSEDTINKRIYRAKEKIRTENIQFVLPPPDQLAERLDAVLHCLYLFFNEGYNSSGTSQLIREELCEESMRLTVLLTKYDITNKSRTNAMLALFCFQASRLRSRLNDKGNIILLKNQDRNLWYRPLIEKGSYYLGKATQSEVSIYHLEASIAWFHTRADSFETTDWKAIHSLYSILLKNFPSPVVALNRSVAALYAFDGNVALGEIQLITGLENFYLFHAAMGEILSALGRKKDAITAFEHAASLTVSEAELLLLREKVSGCLE